MSSEFPSDLTFPTGLAGRLDPVCDVFEWELRTSKKPALEAFLPRVTEADRSHLLTELLAIELEHRRRLGEQPVIDDYLARLPDHADTLARAFASGSMVAPHSQQAPIPVRNEPVAHTDEPPHRVGRYQIEGEIARGGMGVVFRARDSDLNRTLAIKVLRSEYRGIVEVERRFREEAQITGQLQHPSIPPVHELGLLPDGKPFFAMKLILGKTLGHLLTERRSISETLPRFLGVFEHLCQAIAYAHSRGVIHRDLKPSNVMVGNFGEVQVMDWGLAKVLGNTHVVVAEGGATEIAISTVRTDTP